MARGPSYTPLSDGARQWITVHLEYGRTLGLETSDLTTAGEFFDTSLSAVERGEQSAKDADVVVNIAGVFLGEHLCETTDLTWAVSTDQYGTELCVRSEDGRWVFFPRAAAAKRWRARETGWMLPFATMVKGQVSGAPS